MRSLVMLFGGLLVLSIAGQTVNACSCDDGGAPCNAFGSANAVFVGTVLSSSGSERTKQTEQSERDWNPVGYKFYVEQSYLGGAATEIEVFTGRGGGDCGYHFKIGERYLVYAFRVNNKLTTSICTRTKVFSSAAEDLVFLAALPTAAPGVTISGSVIREGEPLPADVFITIEGTSTKKEIRPDAEGRFGISGLPAGKYKVRLHLPKDLSTWQPEQELEVSDHGCAAIAWNVKNNGRVSGQVVNADGEGVPRIEVQLIDPDIDPLKANGLGTATDADGNFVFSEIPKGRYLIAVNHNRFPNPSDPTIAYPPSFYPGVVEQARAQVITIADGEELENIEIRLPSKRPESILSGSVVWSDGSPVAGAQVSVMDVTQNEASGYFGMAADEQGNFRINGYAGEKLIFEARSNRPFDPNGNGPMERVDKMTITLKRPAETVRIVITKLR